MNDGMDDIDLILLDWYEWSENYDLPLNFGGAEPACRDFVISRQWMDYEDLNHEVERGLKAYVGKLVEPLVLKLDLRARLAINTAMRNFECGSVIWLNPGDPRAQDADYAMAKATLRPGLVAVGLLNRAVCRIHSSGL